MTAETLKPFILPTTTNFATQKRNSKSNNKHNSLWIIIGLSAALFALSASLLGLTVWNAIRVSRLEKEVHTVNAQILEIQKRFGLDLFEDLNEFEKEYSKSNKLDDPEIYEESGDLLSNTFDDLEDYEDDEDEDYGDDLILSGSSNSESDEDIYDDENDDDDDDDDEDNDSDNIRDNFEKYGKRKRKTRSVPIDGLVNQEQVPRNNSEAPKAEKHLPPSIRPSKTGFVKSSKSEVNPYGKHKFYKRKHNFESHLRSKLKRPQVKTGQSNKGRSSTLKSLTNQPTVAVHYYLNSTISGTHPYHPAHYKLPHEGDIYIGAPHPWANKIGIENYFEVEHGIIKIKESGVYFIYAQIFYDNFYDRNGYRVYHNDYPFLQCAITIPANMEKSNTCYTSGVIYLQDNDSVHMRDIFKDRVVALRSAKSFFGLIKLGNIA